MILDYNFFDTDNILEPQTGRVLISEPYLTDNYFRRSILLIAEHNSEGTIAFVLNKPIDIPINEIIENFPEINYDLSLGGPVDTDTLHYIHTLGDIIPESTKIFGNIYWGGEFEVIERLIASDNISRDQIKFFLGYSGWSPDQLQNELDENAWVVGDMPANEIMTPMNRNFWKRKLSKMGEKYNMWSNFPEDPEMN